MVGVVVPLKSMLRMINILLFLHSTVNHFFESCAASVGFWGLLGSAKLFSQSIRIIHRLYHTLVKVSSNGRLLYIHGSMNSVSLWKVSGMPPFRRLIFNSQLSYRCNVPRTLLLRQKVWANTLHVVILGVGLECLKLRVPRSIIHWCMCEFLHFLDCGELRFCNWNHNIIFL